MLHDFVLHNLVPRILDHAIRKGTQVRFRTRLFKRIAISESPSNQGGKPGFVLASTLGALPPRLAHTREKSQVTEASLRAMQLLQYQTNNIWMLHVRANGRHV